MIWNYAKMEESNFEQQGIITNLEHTYWDIREQQVAAHIESLEGKGQYVTITLQLPTTIWSLQLNFCYLWLLWHRADISQVIFN
jgi:hypothetical protein